MNEALVAEAKATGVKSEYGFAEWLVQAKRFYGDPKSFSESEWESTYEEAMRIWRVTGHPDVYATAEGGSE